MSGKEQVNIQLFRRWDMSNIEINDPGLKSVINLKPAVIPVTFGRHEHQRLKKAEVNIVERLANKMMHFGKRYAKNTGRMGGKKAKMLNIIKTAFEIIYLETGKKPCRSTGKSNRELFTKRGHNSHSIWWRRLSCIG
jgi:small subunit ribosomal protein S7